MEVINVENAKTQMRRGILEMCVLCIISREEVYPSDIIAQLKDANMLIVEGTLYPLLTRLKSAGFLNYRWVESKSGPPRKYYHITPAGENVKNELVKAWYEVVAAVEVICRHPANNEKSVLANLNSISFTEPPIKL
jgi:PadR family transcriptional regulator PadR